MWWAIWLFHGLTWGLVFIPAGAAIWGRGRTRQVGIGLLAVGLANLAYATYTRAQMVIITE